MEVATVLGRHAELWKAGSGRVQRAAIGALIFASAIFFNVIDPYSHTAGSRADLAVLEATQVQAERKLADMKVAAGRFTQIAATVERGDWQRHKDALIQRFRSGQVSSPQLEADQTVQRIAAQVRTEVLAPLSEAIAQSGVGGALAGYPARLKSRIDTWEREKTGQRWYATLESKADTVVALGATLESVQSEARQVLSQTSQAVDGELSRATQSQATLASDIEAKRANIQKALDAAIPAWARGLVSVERMVTLYPWILVAIAIYLSGSAFIAARHYRGMTSAAGWSGPERSDPLFSSVWTLTWRGAVGTSVTLLCYVAVLGFLGYFLNRSLALSSVSSPMFWLPNLVLLLTLVGVVALPLRERTGRA
jgi:hypothetical protein